MILAVIMITGTISPAIAVTETTDSTTSTAGTETTYPTSDRFTVGKYNLAFDNEVRTGKYLSSSTKRVKSLVATGKAKSVKLNWDSVQSYDKLTGYYIFRRALNENRWYQIASVNNMTTTYTDTTASTKDVLYRYVVVSYKDTGSYIAISKCSPWAGAVTTRSSKKNVTSLDQHRSAMNSSIMIGKSETIILEYSKKPYTTKMRWKSSDTSVLTVDQTGTMKGIAQGKATITARAHTGITISINVTVFKGGTAQSMIDVMESWMGFGYLNGKNMGIVDIYNSCLPLPSGWKMGYYSAWCDCAVSAAAIETGNAAYTGRHCNVGKHVKIFKNLGIWKEGKSVVPKAGDIIVFNWYPRLKNNASHIGIVKSVEGKTITTIEGNMGIGKVGTRTIKVGWKYIRGYARPKYPNK